MTRAYMGWLKLAQDALFKSTGKVATIWFDTLILQVPRSDLLYKVVDGLVSQGQLSSSSRDELLKAWSPITEVLPDYKFLDEPWSNADSALVETAKRVTMSATKSRYPDVDETSYGFNREVSWAGAGLLDSIRAWSALNAKEPCSFLPDEREDAVIRQAFAPKQVSGVELFSEIAADRIPNLDHLSWDKVLELRHHPHLERFRKKLREVQGMVPDGSPGMAREVIADLELHSLRELARSVEPSPGFALVRAICSNLPLPVPLNPASVVLGIDDVAANFDRLKAFGWLYFLIDVKSE